MLGVKRRTTAASGKKTHPDHPVQPAPHAVPRRTSKTTNPVERDIGLLEIQNLSEEQRSPQPCAKSALHLDDSQNFGSDKCSTMSNCNQPPYDYTCHVRVPMAQTQLRSSRKAPKKTFAFGWETYPTRATKNEVCKDFLRNACSNGSCCYRIHPRHKFLPPEVQVLTRTMQECRDGNETTHNSLDGYSLEGVSLRHCIEDQFGTQISSDLVVKLPPAGRQIAPSKNAVPQGLFGKSNVVLSRERNSKITSNAHCRDQPNERPSSDRSLPESSSGLIECSAPSKPNGSVAPQAGNSGYSDLHWDPQTGFWGYHTNEDAWTESNRTSDDGTSDSIFSNTSSQSSLTEEAPDLIQTDISGPPVKHSPPKSSVFCRDWLLNKCSRQYLCPGFHGDLEYDPPVKGRHPPPPSSEICRRWLRNDCKNGYACFFIHNDLEYDTSIQAQTLPPPKILDLFQSPAATGGTSPAIPLSPKFSGHVLSVTIYDHVKAKFTSGFDIQDIITGFETHWVFLDNIPAHVSTEDVRRLLEPFGKIVDFYWRPRMNSSTKTARVRFCTPAEARQASIILDGAQAFDTTICARLPVNDSQKGTVFQDTAVRVQWTAPSKVAYGGFSTMERANKAIEAAQIPFRDHSVKASVHVGLPVVGVVTVRFGGVPLDANEGDMERFAQPDDIVWERANYSSLPRAIHGIKQILEEDAEPLSFEIQPPPYRNGATVCAWAHFPTPGDARAACNRLNGRRPMFTGKTRIFARHFRSLSYSLSPTTFQKLDNNDIQLLRRVAWFRGRATLSIVERNSPQHTLVRMSGDDIKELGLLKAEFENLLDGEVVRQDGKVAWDGFFARPAGALFITELERANPDVTIKKYDHRQMIRLLGSAQNRGKVRQELLLKLHELRSQHIRTLPLDGRLVGLFMGRDLKMLQEELGPENVSLDIFHRNLQIRGNDVAYEAARDAIRRARSRHPKEHLSTSAQCPVCFNQVTAPTTLPCGHCWCRPCLQNYLTSSVSNKYFPLTCLANEAKCTERIPLNIAREILTVSQFDAVVNAAFTAYVQSRPDEFHYCPSPDCPQVYRTATRDTVLQCPSCLLRLCPNCHIEAHDGFACPESGDSLLQEWIKSHDVKNCPGCKIPIERTEGCNHMTCTQCQAHICWVCLQTFPRGEGIYDHMRSVHGGIGLGPAF